MYDIKKFLKDFKVLISILLQDLDFSQNSAVNPHTGGKNREFKNN